MRLDTMKDTLLIQKERRSALGKLLAKENITVNHGNFRTAYFDVKNRILGLPDWTDKSKSVYDMLLGHEVGHALWTPVEFFENSENKKEYAHFDIVNILEDIRIERKIQSTYPGLPRYFKEGYTELYEKNFFGLNGKDISKMSFLDRLNLHAKIGTIIDVPLTDEEQDIFDRAYLADTFDEVLALYHEVLRRLDEEKEENTSNDESGDDSEMPDSDETGDDGESPEDPGSPWSPEEEETEDDGTESHSSTKTDDDSDEESDENKTTSTGVETTDDSEETEELADPENPTEPDSDNELTHEYKSETQREFDENNSADEALQNDGMLKIVPSRKEVFFEHVNDYKKVLRLRKKLPANVEQFEKIKTRYSSNYEKFKKSSKKKVGILVREFEQRKAAWQYARAQESRTGSIDVNKIHRYKYDDQIFSSVTTLADAKSHGMIFLVDYSGSMSSVLGGVLQQTLNLTEFCDKVGVPYQVLSFTSAFYHGRDDSFENEISVGSLIMNELLSSEMSKAEKTFARESLYFQSIERTYGYCSFLPKTEALGGTPLDEVLANMGHIIKKFRAKNRVQKLNVITLTDGDSHHMSCKQYVPRGIKGLCLELDGKTYKVGAYSYRNSSTANLNKIISQHYNVNMIGYFLPENQRIAKNKIKHATWHATTANSQNTDEVFKTWKKEKHIKIKKAFGYSDYYVLYTDVKIEEEEDFEFDGSITDTRGKDLAESRASQNKLAREFAKHYGSTKNTRILMRKFAETIG